MLFLAVSPVSGSKIELGWDFGQSTGFTAPLSAPPEMGSMGAMAFPHNLGVARTISYKSLFTIRVGFHLRQHFYALSQAGGGLIGHLPWAGLGVVYHKWEKEYQPFVQVGAGYSVFAPYQQPIILPEEAGEARIHGGPGLIVLAGLEWHWKKIRPWRLFAALGYSRLPVAAEYQPETLNLTAREQAEGGWVYRSKKELDAEKVEAIAPGFIQDIQLIVGYRYSLGTEKN